MIEVNRLTKLLGSVTAVDGRGEGWVPEGAPAS